MSGEGLNVGLDPSAVGAAGSSADDDFSDQAFEWLVKRPREIGAIQDILADAGLIKGSYAYDYPDSVTVSAYATVLRMAASSDTAPSVILGRMSASNFARNLGAKAGNIGNALSSAASAGPSRAPFTAQVSNPDELRRFFKEAVVGLTGANRGTVDVDAMVEAYQAVQRNAQAAAYNAAPGGGVVEQAPSAEAFAQDQIEQAAPTEVQSRSVVDRAGDLLGMLGNFGGVA